MVLERIAERDVTVRAEDGRPMRLSYRAFLERITVCGETRDSYGIEAELRDGARTECRRFGDLTCRRSEIEMLFLMVVDGIVFPEELEEILGQIIEEKIL